MHYAPTSDGPFRPARPVDESTSLMANPSMSRRGFFSLTAAVGVLTFLGSVYTPRGAMVSAWADEDRKIHFTIYVLGRDELPVLCFDVSDDDNKLPIEGMSVTITSSNNGKSVTTTSNVDGFAPVHIRDLSQQADDDAATSFSFYGSVAASKKGYRQFYHPETYLATGVPASTDGDHSNTLEIPTHAISSDAIYLRTAALDNADVQYCDAECGFGPDNTIEHTFAVEVIAPAKRDIDAKVLVVAPGGKEVVWGEGSLKRSDDDPTSYSATYKGAWLTDVALGSLLKVKFGVHGDITYVMTSRIQFVEEVTPIPDAYGDTTLRPGTDSDDTPDICPIPKWIIAAGDTFTCGFPAFPVKIFSDNKSNFGISFTLLQLTFLKQRNGENKLEDPDKTKHLFGGWGLKKAWQGYKNEVATSLDNFNKCLDNGIADKHGFGRTPFTSKIDASFQLQFLAYLAWKADAKTNDHYWTGDATLALDLGVAASWTKQCICMVPFYFVIDLAADLIAKFAIGMKFGGEFEHVAWGHTLGKSHLAVIIVIHAEVGFTIAMGVAGIAGIGLRGSGYLHFEFVFDEVAGKPSPHITGTLACKAEAFVQLFFLKKTWTIASTPEQNIVDNWASKTSALGAGVADEGLMAAYSPGTMDGATVVTGDELAFAADYVAVKKPITAGEASLLESGDSPAARAGYIMQFTRIDKGLSSDFGLMGAADPNFVDPYDEDGNTLYNPLRGLKPTYVNQLFKDGYSNSRLKVTHSYSGYTDSTSTKPPVVAARLVTVTILDGDGLPHSVTRVALSVWNYDTHSFSKELVLEPSIDDVKPENRYDVDFDYDVVPQDFLKVPGIEFSDVAFVAITSVTRPDEETVEAYEQKQFVTVLKVFINHDAEYNQELGKQYTFYELWHNGYATSGPRVLMQCRLEDSMSFNPIPAQPFVYYYKTNRSTGETTLNATAFYFSDATPFINDVTIVNELPDGLTSSDLRRGGYEVYTTDRKTASSGAAKGEYLSNVLLGWTGRNSSMPTPEGMSDGKQGAPYSFLHAFRVHYFEDTLNASILDASPDLHLPNVSSLTKRTVEDGVNAPFVYHDDTSQSEEKPYMMVVLDPATLAMTVRKADGSTKMNHYFASHDGKWLYTVRTVKHEVPGLSEDSQATVEGGGAVYSSVYKDDSNYGDLGDVPMTGGQLTSYQLLEARWHDGLDSYYQFYPIAQLDFCPDNIDVICHLDGRRDFIFSNITAADKDDTSIRYELGDAYDMDSVYHVADIYHVCVPHALGLHVKNLKLNSPYAAEGEPAYLSLELANTGNWYISGFEVEFYGPDDQLITTTAFTDLENRVQDTRHNYKQVLDDTGAPSYDEDGMPLSEQEQSRLDRLGLLAPGATRTYRIEFTMPAGLEGDTDFSLRVKNPRCEASDIRTDYISADEHQIDSSLAFVDPNLHGATSSGGSGVEHVWAFYSKGAPYAREGEDPQPEQHAITSQPVSVTAKSGDTVTLSLTAVGAATYQWQTSQDGETWSATSWSGYDSDTLTFAMTEDLDGRRWRCVVAFTDKSEAASDVVTTTLEVPPPTPESSISFDQTAASLFTGDTLALAGTITGPATEFEVTNSEEAVAKASFDAATGKLTIEAIGAGAATLTVSPAASEAYIVSGTATIEVTVKDRFVGRFPDVQDPNEWYFDSVYKAADMGLFNGYDNGYFGPNDSLKRAQAAVVLWHYYAPTEESTYDKNVTNNKTNMRDVANNQWYTGAANWAYAQGVISGREQADGSRLFAPDDTISREELMAIMASCAARFERADVDGASDAELLTRADASKVSSWAYQSVAWCVQEGVVSGKEIDGLQFVAPQDQLTRAEMAAIMVNFETRKASVRSR